MKNIPSKLIALAALMSAASVLPAPALAQDGIAMRNIFGKLGILPEEKDPIIYHERPALVVPKDTTKLRAPEQPESHARNGAWPTDPDVMDRKRAQAQRNAPVLFPTASNAGEGGRLSLKELAAGRSTRGAVLGEGAIPRNDQDGVRVSAEEMKAAGRTASAPSYPPGTEPPRVYLTDPPKGLRLPSNNAPVGRRTSEGPIKDSFRPSGVWDGKE